MTIDQGELFKGQNRRDEIEAELRFWASPDSPISTARRVRQMRDEKLPEGHPNRCPHCGIHVFVCDCPPVATTKKEENKNG